MRYELIEKLLDKKIWYKIYDNKTEYTSIVRYSSLKTALEILHRANNGETWVV